MATPNQNPYEALRDELAAIAHDLRDSGKFMRGAVERQRHAEETMKDEQWIVLGFWPRTWRGWIFWCRYWSPPALLIARWREKLRRP